MKILINDIKLLFKKLFCKHTYIWKSTVKGRRVDNGKYIVFFYNYECSKCKKELNVKMDKEYQNEINFEYN